MQRTTKYSKVDSTVARGPGGVREDRGIVKNTLLKERLLIRKSARNEERKRFSNAARRLQRFGEEGRKRGRVGLSRNWTNFISVAGFGIEFAGGGGREGAFGMVKTKLTLPRSLVEEAAFHRTLPRFNY